MPALHDIVSGVYTGIKTQNGAEITTGASLAGQLFSDAHLAARVARPFVKSDTPLQRLIKSQPLESMQDHNKVGDAEHGIAAFGAGYLIARRKGLGRMTAKLAGIATAGGVIGATHAWHNHDVDRSIPHYNET